MRARVVNLLQNLQASYYFIPGLMGVGAILLSILAIWVDARHGAVLQQYHKLFYNDPAGARTLLATISGSMIGVAATAFSITMVAVTSAAGQYGPRLIGNFMRDRGNQFVLGTFTATFLYSLLVLRAVRDTDQSEVAQTQIFIPGFSILLALALTIAAIGVLIYFIHHVPETLNVGNITAKVGRQLKADILKVYGTDEELEREDQDVDLSTFKAGEPYWVHSNSDGFIQTLEITALIKAAKSIDGVVEVIKQPGSFVTQGENLVRVWSENEWSDDCAHKLRGCYAIGLERTAHQNLLFLADELIEILARALSPGVNDPYTAINCIHWLKAATIAFLNGKTPAPIKRDSDQNVRVINPAMDFEEFFSTIMRRLTPYVVTDVNVLRSMQQCLDDLIEVSPNKEYSELIRASKQTLSQSA